MSPEDVERSLIELSAELSGHEALFVALVDTHPQLGELLRRYDEEAYRRTAALRASGQPESAIVLAQQALENFRNLIRERMKARK